MWRYSRIDDLDLDRFVARRPASTTVEHGALGPGTSLGRASELDGAEALLGPAARGRRTRSSWLRSRARRRSRSLIDVAGGRRRSADPVVVRHTGRRATAPRPPSRGSSCGPGADSEVTRRRGLRGRRRRPRSLPVTELALASAARVGLRRASRTLDRATWQIGHLRHRGRGQATVVAGLAGFGGDYARVRTDCRLVGRGATGDLLAVYFGDGDQTLDFRTFQDHVAPDTTSNLLFKGAVERPLPVRLHRADPGAARTPGARTPSRPTATSSSPTTPGPSRVPNLEIENNDVHCSHASTVGPIDEEQRFYLESRGVPDPRWPSGSSWSASSTRCSTSCPDAARPADARCRDAGGAPTKLERRCTAMSVGLDAAIGLPARRPRPTGTARRRRRSATRGIAVVRIGDDVYAIGDVCSHQDISLSEGEVLCDERADRVLEARQRLLPRDGRARVAAGHEAGAGVRGPRRRRPDRGGASHD